MLNRRLVVFVGQEDGPDSELVFFSSMFVASPVVEVAELLIAYQAKFLGSRGPLSVDHPVRCPVKTEVTVAFGELKQAALHRIYFSFRFEKALVAGSDCWVVGLQARVVNCHLHQRTRTVHFIPKLIVACNYAFRLFTPVLVLR